MMSKKSFKRLVAMALAVVTTASMVGCGNGGSGDDGKIVVEVGRWPNETQTAALERYERYKQEFEAENPNIKIVPNTYTYDTKTFTVKASAGQLPTLYDTYFTEADMIIKNGYAADISKSLEDTGLMYSLNPDVLGVVSDDNGKVFGFPYSVYAQGLVINKELFVRSGLVNADGSVMIPQTYEELAEYASIIKEKTGVSGFALPTTNNCGGWHLVNLAWSNGVKFEEQNADGKWEATFDSENFRETLRYIHDLKWNRDVLPVNSVIDATELFKIFGTGQTAMIIANSSTLDEFVVKYGMDKDNIVMAKLPAGTEGRYSQMGGNFWAFSSTATTEQIEAGLKWLQFTGYNPVIDEEATRETNKERLDEGKIIFPKELFSVWQDEKRKADVERINAEYANVDMANYQDYYDFGGVTLKPEVEKCCQELYSVLDSVVQEVFSNKNVNIEELSSKAANNFQVNYLDKAD